MITYGFSINLYFYKKRFFIFIHITHLNCNIKIHKNHEILTFSNNAWGKNQNAFFMYITLLPRIKIYLNSILVSPFTIYFAFVNKMFIVPSKQFKVPRKNVSLSLSLISTSFPKDCLRKSPGLLLFFYIDAFFILAFEIFNEKKNHQSNKYNESNRGNSMFIKIQKINKFEVWLKANNFEDNDIDTPWINLTYRECSGHSELKKILEKMYFLIDYVPRRFWHNFKSTWRS